MRKTIILRDFFIFICHAFIFSLNARDAHHLSNTKYQIELAIGSTIASVNAIMKDTSATNIKTVIAIKKCPIV